MHTTKAPRILQWLYPTLTWHRPRDKKRIYLTFDDGPIPDVTPWILNTLKKYDIKATFFCVGQNIEKYPELYQRILDEGHQTGNHTYNHINGWKHEKEVYLLNADLCQQFTKSPLFRPPYGKITRKQYKTLQKKGFEIIMWDVLSGDVNPQTSPEQCLKNVIKHTENGSIVVFHDNIKATKKISFALPQSIAHWLKEGYEFHTL